MREKRWITKRPRTSPEEVAGGKEGDMGRNTRSLPPRRYKLRLAEEKREGISVTKDDDKPV